MAQVQQIVVAYDFTNSGRAALLRAIEIAARAKAVFHFVCVVEPHGTLSAVPRTGPADYHYAERVQQTLANEVAGELRIANVEGDIQFFVHARIGKPAEQILALARDVGADVIIVGTKGLTGVERAFLGSVAEHVVREALCAVMVARPKHYTDVPLMKMTDVEPDHHFYIPPHRYSYEQRQLQLRPDEWPLY